MEFSIPVSLFVWCLFAHTCLKLYTLSLWNGAKKGQRKKQTHLSRSKQQLSKGGRCTLFTMEKRSWNWFWFWFGGRDIKWGPGRISLSNLKLYEGKFKKSIAFQCIWVDFQVNYCLHFHPMANREPSEWNQIKSPWLRYEFCVTYSCTIYLPRNLHSETGNIFTKMARIFRIDFEYIIYAELAKMSLANFTPIPFVHLNVHPKRQNSLAKEKQNKKTTNARVKEEKN